MTGDGGSVPAQAEREIPDSPLIFLIAGEPSGDQIGGLLMDGLRRRKPSVRFAGIGGDTMVERGLNSLFPMGELAVMGLVEILPHIRRLLGCIRQTADAIVDMRPDAIVTIDAPGFNKRVVRTLRQRQARGMVPDVRLPPLIHYVAPTVWAWRPKRAETFAQLFDGLLVLLPFEPPLFEKHGLATRFVGHPATEMAPGQDVADALRLRFRRTHAIASHTKLLCLLPGSRRGEVRRLLPVFRDAVDRVATTVPGLRVVLPTVTGVADQVRGGVAGWSRAPMVLCTTDARRAALAASDVALAASGTVALETGLAGLPTVVGYKANPLTVAIVRRLITVKYVNLINILLDRAAIPERLQEHCTAATLSTDLVTLLTDSAAAIRQKEAFRRAAQALQPPGGVRSSDRAAEAVLDAIAATFPPRGVGRA